MVLVLNLDVFFIYLMSTEKSILPYLLTDPFIRTYFNKYQKIEFLRYVICFISTVYKWTIQ